jgi:hypothetical protein
MKISRIADEDSVSKEIKYIHTYIYVWEIDNFVIKSDILRGLIFLGVVSIFKIFFKKLSCYHGNYTLSTLYLENIMGLLARRGFLYA